MLVLSLFPCVFPGYKTFSGAGSVLDPDLAQVISNHWISKTQLFTSINFVLQSMWEDLTREVERGSLRDRTGTMAPYWAGLGGHWEGIPPWDGIPRAAPGSLAQWKCPCHGVGMSSRVLPSPGAISGGTGTAPVPAGSQDCPLCLPSQPRLSQGREMPFFKISLAGRSCQFQSRDPAWSWGSVPSSALGFS